VQPHHRLFHAARDEQVELGHRVLHGELDGFALVGRRLAQHVVRDLGLDAGVTDAQTQPPVVGAAELGVDVA
jgi:hypothetical protein